MVTSMRDAVTRSVSISFRRFLDFPLEKAAAFRFLHDFGLSGLGFGWRSWTRPIAGRRAVQIPGKVHGSRASDDLGNVRKVQAPTQ
jgi:hypothetical protein